MSSAAPHSLESSARDDDFSRVITDLAKALELNSHSDYQQETFFKMAESRQKLPVVATQNSNNNLALEFLSATISIISLKENTLFVKRALKILLCYLRYDPIVFQTFTPNRPLLRKIDLEQHIRYADDALESEAALEFACFLIRYHRFVEHADFSEDATTVQRIRRFCEFKIWVEIESNEQATEEVVQNLTDFKDVTQKALREIVQHLENVSSQSQRKFQTEAADLNRRVSDNIAAMNEQMAEIKSKRGSQSQENYRKILEIMMQLESKLQSTASQQLVGDLKAQVQRVLESRDQGLSGNYLGLKNDLTEMQRKVDQIGREEALTLRRELENTISRHQMKHDADYERLVQLLADVERKMGGKIVDEISELKQTLDELIKQKLWLQENKSEETQKRILDTINLLEKKLDNRSEKQVGSLRKDFENLLNDRSGRQELNVERVLSGLHQLEARSDVKSKNLNDQVDNLRREVEKLLNERSRTLEHMMHTNQDRALQLMVDLEQKLDKRIATQIEGAQTNLSNQIDDVRSKSKSSSKDLQQNLFESAQKLEQKVNERQDRMQEDLRHQFFQILENQINKVEGLSNESYKKVLQLLLDLEKKLDQQQGALMKDLQSDFAKLMDRLEAQQLKTNDLEDQFMSRLGEMQGRLADQERSLSGQFQAQLKLADQQMTQMMNQKLSQSNSEYANILNSKMSGSNSDVDTRIQEKVDQLKDSVQLQITQQLQQQRQTMSDALRDQLDQRVRHLESQIKTMHSQVEETKYRQQESQMSPQGVSRQEVDSLFTRRSDELNDKMNQRFDTRIDSVSKLIKQKLENQFESLKSEMIPQIEFCKNKLGQVDEEMKKMQSQIENVPKKLKVQESKLQASPSMLSMGAKNPKIDQLQSKFSKFEIVQQEFQEMLREQKNSTRELVEIMVDEKASMDRRSFEEMLNKRLENLNIESLQKGISGDLVELKGHVDRKILQIQDSIKDQTDDAILQNSKELSESIFKQVLEEQNKLNTNFSTTYQQSVQRLGSSLTEQIDQLENNYRELANSVADLTLNVQKAGDKQQIDQMQLQLESLSGISQKRIDANEASIIQINGKLKAHLEEFDSIVDIKTSNVQRTLIKQIQSQFDNTFEPFKDFSNKSFNDYKQSIQILDRELKSATDKVYSFDGKMEQMQVSLKEQVDIIQNLNLASDSHKAKVEQIELMQSKKNQNLLDGIKNIEESLSKGHVSPEQFAELMRVVSVLHQNDELQGRDINFLKDRIDEELEAKLSLILRNRDDLLKRVEQCEKDMEAGDQELSARFYKDLEEMANNMDANKESIERILKVIGTLETDLHVQVDRSIRDLEQTDLKQQKAIGDISDEFQKHEQQFQVFRDLISAELKDEFAKINSNFESQFNIITEKETDLKKEMTELRDTAAKDDAFQSLKDSMDRHEKQIKLHKDGLEDLFERNENLNSISADMDKRIEPLKKELAQYNRQIGDLSKLKEAQKEFTKLWVFFQNFIDEQGMDQTKIIRSADSSIVAKIDAMEWLARYSQFVTPDTIITAVKEFKEIYATPVITNVRKDLIEAVHHSEGIPTIIQEIRSLKAKIEAGEIDIFTYDQTNSLLLSILDPLLINELSLDMFIKLNGMVDVCRLMLEQPMPSEIDTFDYSKSYVNSSFRFTIRCIMQAVRNDRGTTEFLANPQWLNRMLQFLEEWKEEDAVIAGLRAIKMIMKSDQNFAEMATKFPNMANFMLIMTTVFSKSPTICAEAILGLKYIFRRPEYAQLISAANLTALSKMRQNPVHEMSHARIDEINQRLIKYKVI